MTGSPAPDVYSQRNEANWRDHVSRALKAAFKKGGDVEISAGRLILTDTATGARYSVVVTSGVLSVVPL